MSIKNNGDTHTSENTAAASGERLLLIASPTAGKLTTNVEQVEAALDKYEVPFEKIVAHTPAEAAKAVQRVRKNEHRAVAVYGGDGTVIAVLRALARTDMPILIFRGGSGNVIARSIGIPANADRYIETFKQNDYVLRYYPLARANREPFVLYAHFGLFSDAIHSTPKHLKRWIGEYAYRLNTLGLTPNAKKHTYQLEIDGETVRHDGYACSIVNMGEQYIFGVRVWPSAQYGMLRAMIVRKKSPWQLLRWYLLRLTTSRNLQQVISIWSGETIKVVDAPPMMSFDDHERASSLPLAIGPTEDNVRIVTLPKSAYRLSGYLRWLGNSFNRNIDQLRRSVTGVPSDRYSRINKHLYVGGQYYKQAYDVFEERGITGIISMRLWHRPAKLPNGANFEVLHLPTTDHKAPTLGQLEEGVEFIRRHVEKNGAVYVHCHLGEGRGPTMAAAYLISEGMRPQDALAHLRRFRPFAKPNKRQRKRLMEFAEKYTKSTGKHLKSS